MSVETVVIYSHRIDPAGVLRILRELAPGLSMEGRPESWKRITITGPRRLLRKPKMLSFSHDPAYYTRVDWAAQMRGMQVSFSKFPRNQNSGRIPSIIESFRFAVSLFPPPQPALKLDSRDERLRYVFAVARFLDGVIFTPDSLRDAAGRSLYGARKADPRAVLPGANVSSATDARTPASRVRRSAADVGQPPPTEARVARRALALCAVSGRALLEQEDSSNPAVEQTRQRILQWIEETGIAEEFEPNEWNILQLPLGVPPKQDALNAAWRMEGLGVLAWALGVYELPPYDQRVDPLELLPCVGFTDTGRASELLQAPRLRPPEEIHRLRDRLFAIHWRLAAWRRTRRPMNFLAFAQTAPFGPIELTDVRLLDDDLALGQDPIGRASPDAIARARSAAVERLRAANWLCGGSVRYARTSISS